MSFPAGKHDDCVDALGLIGQLLDHIMPGNKPKPLKEKKIESGYRQYDFPRANDWLQY